MWNENILSGGDLSHDEYLQKEVDSITVTPRFQSSADVWDRIEHIDNIIMRLNEEKQWLLDHGNAFINKMSYADISECEWIDKG